MIVTTLIMINIHIFKYSKESCRATTDSLNYIQKIEMGFRILEYTNSHGHSQSYESS